MLTCTRCPTDKRAFGQAIGDELLRRHGKRRSYALDRICDVVDALGFPFEWSRWACALYGSPEDFAARQAALGEGGDYADMKAEMFAAMTEGASSSWFDTDMSWLEWPDFDFGSLFSFFDV